MTVVFRILFAAVLLLPIACIVGAALLATGAYLADWMTDSRTPQWERRRAHRALRKVSGA